MSRPVLDGTPRWLRVRYRAPDGRVRTWEGRITRRGDRLFGEGEPQDLADGGIARHYFAGHVDDVVSLAAHDPRYETWERLPWPAGPDTRFAWRWEHDPDNPACACLDCRPAAPKPRAKRAKPDVTPPARPV